MTKERHPLAELRELAGLSQAGLAKVIGCPKNHVGGIEARRVQMDEDFLGALQGATGVNPDTLHQAVDGSRKPIEDWKDDPYTAQSYREWHDSPAHQDELDEVTAFAKAALPALLGLCKPAPQRKAMLDLYRLLNQIAFQGPGFGDANAAIARLTKTEGPTITRSGAAIKAALSSTGTPYTEGIPDGDLLTRIDSWLELGCAGSSGPRRCHAITISMDGSSPSFVLNPAGLEELGE